MGDLRILETSAIEVMPQTRKYESTDKMSTPIEISVMPSWIGADDMTFWRPNFRFRRDQINTNMDRAPSEFNIEDPWWDLDASNN
jgi:hypothetical protein